MPRHRNLDPDDVRREYLRQGGNVRLTAAALGTTRQTVYAALDRTEPLVVPSVTVNGLDPKTEDAKAIAVYVRKMLERVGILKEPPSTGPSSPGEGTQND
jgi:hypothetical protein